MAFRILRWLVARLVDRELTADDERYMREVYDLAHSSDSKAEALIDTVVALIIVGIVLPIYLLSRVGVLMLKFLRLR